MSQYSYETAEKKFIKKFNDIYAETITNNRIIITQNEMILILQKLNFLQSHIDPIVLEQEYQVQYSKERELVRVLFEILNGPESRTIYSRNLLIILLGVLNFQSPDELNPFPNQAEKTMLFQDQGEKKPNAKIGTFDVYGNLSLSKEEVGQVHKIFQVFFVNYMMTKGPDEKVNCQSNFNYAFAPILSMKSVELAPSRRSKVIEKFKNSELHEPPRKKSFSKEGSHVTPEKAISPSKISNFLSIETYFECLDSNIKDKIYHQQMENAENMMKDCTFQPKLISQKKIPPEEEKKDQPKVHRTQALYDSSKKKRIKKDISPIENDYLQNCDECTFVPNIERMNVPKTRLYSPSSIESHVKRMQKSIEEKEIDKELARIGITPSSSLRCSLKDKAKKEVQKSILEKH